MPQIQTKMAYKQVLLVCALFQLSSAALEVPGKLLSSSSDSTYEGRASDEPTCDGVGVYSTCSDCNNVLVCLGSTQDAKQCNAPSSATPFCVKGECSASANTAAGCFPPGMNCTGAGFYPDPKNCQIYHYCEAIGELSSVYECPPNYAYNSETTLCKQRIFTTDCAAVQCDQGKTFVGYGSSKKYFALCKFENNAVTTIQVLKCPDNCYFDGMGCVFKCPRIGNFAHIDAAKYYQCYYDGSQLVYATQSCPGGKNFDQKVRACVTSKMKTVPMEKAADGPLNQESEDIS